MGFSFFPPPLFPKKIKYHYKDPATSDYLSDELSDLLIKLSPNNKKDILVLCVGTDRSTGDCLGPLVGWLLSQKAIDFFVYGTLDDPIHAGNLSEKIHSINLRHKNPLIIAVDACLGKMENVGIITLGEGVIKPGAGVFKELPSVGNVYFIGTVNIAGHMEFIVLQNTRLSLVMNMAKVISQSVVMGVQKAQKKWPQVNQKQKKI